VKCPSCGREAQDDARTCAGCGTDLDEARRLAIRARMKARLAPSEAPDAVDRFVSGAILVEKPAKRLDGNDE